MDERDRRQRRAVEIQARQKLAGDVLGVTGAAAVAGDHELAAGAEDRLDQIGDGADSAMKLLVVRRQFHGRNRMAKIASDRIVREFVHRLQYTLAR